MAECNELPEGHNDFEVQNEVIVLEEEVGEAAAQLEPDENEDHVTCFIVESDDEGFGDDEESRLELRGAWAKDIIGIAQPCKMCELTRNIEVLTTICCPKCDLYFCPARCFLGHIYVVNRASHGENANHGHNIITIRIEDNEEQLN